MGVGVGVELGIPAGLGIGVRVGVDVGEGANVGVDTFKGLLSDSSPSSAKLKQPTMTIANVKIPSAERIRRVALLIG